MPLRSLYQNWVATVPSDLREKVSEIAGLGGTPLTVCENNKILGVIYLKDTVKPGMVERFERLREHWASRPLCVPVTIR